MIKRNAVQMPDLAFSPFLPLQEQIEKQRQLDALNLDPISARSLPHGFEMGADDSLQRLNKDLPSPQQQQMQDHQLIGSIEATAVLETSMADEQAIAQGQQQQ